MPHIDRQTQSRIEAKIRWTKYIDPTEGEDVAHGSCVFDDYIAVVGEIDVDRTYPGRGRPYVVLLRKSDGGVVRDWIGSEKGGFSNCISIDGKLYAVGITSVDDNLYGVIYVFDVNLHILARIKSESPSGYTSLAYDGKALYLGGWAYEDVDGDDIEEPVAFVEKRVLDKSLSLVNSKKIYIIGSWEWGGINDIGVEPSTDRIWIVGLYKDSKGKTRSLIVVFDADLREFEIIDYPEGSEGYLGVLYGIAFDGKGYAYILGDIGVAKFSANGELIAINKGGRVRSKIVYDKIVYDKNYLYIFGCDEIGGYRRHMLYIHDINLNIVKRYVLSENVNAHSCFSFGGPALEGNNIYVAGYDRAPGENDTRIVIYSLSIEGLG